MASQNDLNFAVQRAWVRTDVKVAGPIKVIGSEISGSFTLELLNTGSLPAYVDVSCKTALCWDMNPATSDDPRITYVINGYKTAPLTRRGIIFPQQMVSEPYTIVIRKDAADIAKNIMMGLVAVLRGAIRYDYPGSIQTHFTTYHVHVMTTPGPAAALSVHPIPTDDGTVVPVSHLFVTNQVGETEAT